MNKNLLYFLLFFQLYFLQAQSNESKPYTIGVTDKIESKILLDDQWVSICFSEVYKAHA